MLLGIKLRRGLLALGWALVLVLSRRLVLLRRVSALLVALLGHLLIALLPVALLGHLLIALLPVALLGHLLIALLPVALGALLVPRHDLLLGRLHHDRVPALPLLLHVLDLIQLLNQQTAVAAAMFVLK